MSCEIEMTSHSLHLHTHATSPITDDEFPSSDVPTPPKSSSSSRGHSKQKSGSNGIISPAATNHQRKSQDPPLPVKSKESSSSSHSQELDDRSLKDRRRPSKNSRSRKPESKEEEYEKAKRELMKNPNFVRFENGWSEHISSSGKHYYYNFQTRQTVWEKPTTHQSKSNHSLRTDGDWSEHVSSTGMHYYYNNRTKAAVWEKPEGFFSDSQPRHAKQSSAKGVSPVVLKKEENVVKTEPDCTPNEDNRSEVNLRSSAPRAVKTENVKMEPDAKPSHSLSSMLQNLVKCQKTGSDLMDSANGTYSKLAHRRRTIRSSSEIINDAENRRLNGSGPLSAPLSVEIEGSHCSPFTGANTGVSEQHSHRDEWAFISDLPTSISSSSRRDGKPPLSTGSHHSGSKRSRHSAPTDLHPVKKLRVEDTSAENPTEETADLPASPGVCKSPGLSDAEDDAAADLPASPERVELPPSSHFYDPELVMHIVEWPIAPLETQCLHLMKEDSKYSSSMFQTTVDLKFLRSLVRVNEIQSTLQSARVHFIREQILELENSNTILNSAAPTSAGTSAETSSNVPSSSSHNIPVSR